MVPIKDREKGILFTASMVQANKAGIKGETRRLIKPQPEYFPAKGLESEGWSWQGKKVKLSAFYDIENFKTVLAKACPYGFTGDSIWVRETYRFYEDDLGSVLQFRASSSSDPDSSAPDVLKGKRWTPSIHMCRRHCRDAYDITSVKAERLHDISEEACLNEGIIKIGSKKFAHFGACNRAHDGSFLADIKFIAPSAKEAYKLLWEDINGSGSWDLNPWVWVIIYDNPQKKKKR